MNPILFFQGIVNFLTGGGETIRNLKSQSDGAVSMFTVAMTKLRAVNSQITSQISTRNEKLKEIYSEISDLSSIMEQNSKTITNIEKIIE